MEIDSDTDKLEPGGRALSSLSVWEDGRREFLLVLSVVFSMKTANKIPMSDRRALMRA